MARTRGWLLAAATLAAALGGCGGDEQKAQQITMEEAKVRARALVPEGTVGNAALHPEPGVVHWMVSMTMPGGGVVLVELFAHDGTLAEIESGSGPFDYEIRPPGAIAYTRAREVALATKAGAIEVWEFDAEKPQWEFYVRDVDTHLWEIKMSAGDGVVTSVEEKAKPD